MKKKWREFERLVARIEKLLSPYGAIVKSPDRIIPGFYVPESVKGAHFDNSPTFDVKMS